MKTRMLKWLAVLLVISPCAWASSPPWTGDGIFTFDDTDDFFFEGSITDTATVNILGGSFGALHCYQYSTVNMSGGSGNGISAGDQSMVYLTGGDLNFVDVDALSSSQIHMTVLNYVFNPDSYLGYDELSGCWASTQTFDILINEGTFSHFDIQVIPEPCSISILILGFLFMRKSKKSDRL